MASDCEYGPVLQQEGQGQGQGEDSDGETLIPSAPQALGITLSRSSAQLHSRADEVLPLGAASAARRVCGYIPGGGTPGHGPPSRMLRSGHDAPRYRLPRTPWPVPAPSSGAQGGVHPLRTVVMQRCTVSLLP